VRVGENLDEAAKNSAILEYEIYMNHVLDYKGFRFFQESYDLDERGTILSINKDPGKFPTYFGYFLLSLGLVLNIFNPKSRFRYLMRLIDESSRDQISNTQQKNRKSKQISGANLAVFAKISSSGKRSKSFCAASMLSLKRLICIFRHLFEKRVNVPRQMDKNSQTDTNRALFSLFLRCCEMLFLVRCFLDIRACSSNICDYL